VGTWRTECFFYPFVVLAVLLLLGKNRLKRALALATAGITLIGILGINFINNQRIGNHNYTLTSTLLPVCTILRESDDLDETTLATLDKVINVEVIKTTTTFKNNYPWYKTNGVIRNYTEAEYTAYLGAVAQIICQHPQIAMDAWLINFQKNPSFSKNTKKIKSIFSYTIDSFINTQNTHYYWFNNEEFPYINNSYFYEPINCNLRNDFLTWIMCIELNENSTGEFSYYTTPHHNLFYSLKIPVVLYLLGILITILCRRWFVLIPCAAMLCHFVITFCTAPTNLHFYYQSIHLFMCVFGIAMITYGITHLIGKFRKKNQTTLPSKERA
ncbi:MAG: hypothetical protein NC133_02265, partial [Prevotella sp.]|nr:hypothetical protein [Prevotella sp.]